MNPSENQCCSKIDGGLLLHSVVVEGVEKAQMSLLLCLCAHHVMFFPYCSYWV